MKILAMLMAVLGLSVSLRAQVVQVSGTVIISRQDGTGSKVDQSGVVVWLKPLGESRHIAAPVRTEIRQQAKRFDPHVLVIPAGSSVAFPNLDPFFHNVFSMFDGKRFDLGLYERGSSHSVVFDRVGVCFIFCNIHPEMSALVVVVDTPYYAVSNRAGSISIPNVPAGRYLLSVFHERAKPPADQSAAKEITISAENPRLPALHLVDSGVLVQPHKNKYGRDYDKPASTTVYH